MFGGHGAECKRRCCDAPVSLDRHADVAAMLLPKQSANANGSVCQGRPGTAAPPGFDKIRTGPGCR
jgi:hypothetical protein